MARLARQGPNCSPKMRVSPGNGLVWSRPLASIAIWFQRCSVSRPRRGLILAGSWRSSSNWPPSVAWKESTWAPACVANTRAAATRPTRRNLCTERGGEGGKNISHFYPTRKASQAVRDEGRLLRSERLLRKPFLRKHFTEYLKGLMVRIHRPQRLYQGPTGGVAPMKNG